MTTDLLTHYRETTERLTAPGAPFALVDVMVRGRATRVYASADANIADILLRAAARFGDRALIVEEGRSWRYDEIFGAGARLAGALRDDHGIGPGTRVGLVMRNRAEWFVAFAGIVGAGAMPVLFNSRGAPAELAAAAADVSCALILGDDERLERLRAGGTATPLAGLADIARWSGADREPIAPVRVDPDAGGLILFTSGTTGRPKGAVLTQRNITNMVRNLAFLTELNLDIAAYTAGMPLDALRPLLPRLTSLLVNPLFHISGLNAFFSTIEAGGLLVGMRRWDPAEALRLIARYRVTMVSGPPLVLGDLLAEPDAQASLATIGAIGVGGQATPASLVQQVTAALPRVAQSAGWGMTETTGSITAAAGAIYLAKSGSCGGLSPIGALRILDEAGAELPPGETGELWVGGALVMQGYHDAPEANAATMPDGWLRTGDIGYLDADGFLHLVARMKDMVISAGENIYCAEIERVLGAEAEFSEVALFGVTDPRLGERAIAAVTLRPGARWDEAAVKALARRSLADYKVPAEVSFTLGPLPRNATGKVDKAALRARYAASTGATR